MRAAQRREWPIEVSRFFSYTKKGDVENVRGVIKLKLRTTRNRGDLMKKNSNKIETLRILPRKRRNNLRKKTAAPCFFHPLAWVVPSLGDFLALFAVVWLALVLFFAFLPTVVCLRAAAAQMKHMSSYGGPVFMCSCNNGLPKDEGGALWSFVGPLPLLH